MVKSAHVHRVQREGAVGLVRAAIGQLQAVAVKADVLDVVAVFRQQVALRSQEGVEVVALLGEERRKGVRGGNDADFVRSWSLVRFAALRDDRRDAVVIRGAVDQARVGEGCAGDARRDGHGSFAVGRRAAIDAVAGGIGRGLPGQHGPGKRRRGREGGRRGGHRRAVVVEDRAHRLARQNLHADRVAQRDVEGFVRFGRCVADDRNRERGGRRVGGNGQHAGGLRRNRSRLLPCRPRSYR